VSQPDCEYCGEEGSARFEGFSVCTDCDYRLRQSAHQGGREERRSKREDTNWITGD
jgi:hypothetical protein